MIQVKGLTTIDKDGNKRFRRLDVTLKDRARLEFWRQRLRTEAGAQSVYFITRTK